MKRIDEILRHETFRKHLSDINEAEKTRCFCNHDMEHLMDVARIAWIMNLEEGLGLEKELAALRDSEMWRTAEVVRQLRPENN